MPSFQRSLSRVPRNVSQARHALLLLAWVVGASRIGAAVPQTSADPEPEITRTAAGTTEIGTLATVPYRLDVPPAWNPSLVV